MADGAPHIRLRGTAHIHVHAAREAGKLAISGTVADDAARPVDGAHITIALARAIEPGASIPWTTLAPEACSGETPASEANRAGPLVFTTDQAGRFCVRIVLAADQYVARIEMPASGLVDGASVDWPVDLIRPEIILRFEPERSVLSLDDDTMSLDVVASTEDEGVPAGANGLILSLSNESGARLGSATTDSSGRARFTLESARLGPPGRGELHAIFAGTAGEAASSLTMAVERRTRVDVAAPDSNAGRLPIGWPDNGVAVRVVATARCRGCVGLPTGTIEAWIGKRTPVGAAQVTKGEARLLMTFSATSVASLAAAEAAEVPVTFRFIADAPWFQPAGDLVLLQPVRGPSPWRTLPLALAAGAVVAWMALARLPFRWRRRRRPVRPPRPADPGAGVSLVRTATTSHGWTGRVSDAQDGFAISDARVAIERRGFDRVDVVSETTTDLGGAFTLHPIEAHPGDELVAEGPVHAALRHALPSPGELAVVLVLRKRALLDRLVAWARRRGVPYVDSQEPTPGHVCRVAGADVAVARWANAVEMAAYSGDVVDERVEADVDRLAPDG